MHGTAGDVIVKKKQTILRRKNPIKEEKGRFISLKEYLNESFPYEYDDEKMAKGAADSASKRGGVPHIVAKMPHGKHYITPNWNKQHVQSKGHTVVSYHALGRERKW